MNQETDLSQVKAIMLDFAHVTGLSSEHESRRYLWTDAFAVCNFLELHRRTDKTHYRDLALELVDEVHYTLGRHREDDARTGWISGLPEGEGQERPTAGGLRIGKPLSERQPGESYDQRLEWERDGQYYHYLTKWMHALNRVSQVTGEPRYHRWAVELAATAHDAFTYAPAAGGPQRMFWKMSIDLSRPLVPSMGQHDPLDGLLTYHELASTAPDSVLDEEMAEMTAICRGKSWVTDDPLGIGGLLTDAYRTAQLMVAGALEGSALLMRLIEAAEVGLGIWARQNPLTRPVRYRLAFRELGLAIGLHAVERLWALVEQEAELGADDPSLPQRIESLTRYVPLTREIEAFWLVPSNQKGTTWMEHLDINRVMLATSLAPEGYLHI